MTALILIVIVIAGTLLLIRGLRGRRVGDTPYCPKCGYDLTGLTSHRCPECGRDFTPETILRGRRHRRPVAITVGFILLAVGLFVLTAVQHNIQINWYRHMPFGSLLLLANGGNDEALGEIDTRYVRGNLRPAQISRLADACLDKHKTIATSQSESTLHESWSWLILLGKIASAGQLTYAQRDRLDANLVTSINLEVRSPIRPGDPIPGRITFWCCVPPFSHHDGGVVAAMRGQSILIDGRQTPLFIAENAQPPDPQELGSLFSGPWNVPIGAMPVPPFAPGKHQLRYVGELAIRQSNPLVSATPFRWSRPLDFTRSVQVVSSDKPDPVRLVETPTLRNLLQHSIGFQFLPASATPSESSATFRPDAWRLKFINTVTLPVAVAFDVTVLVGNRRYAAGQMWSDSGPATPVYDQPLFAVNEELKTEDILAATILLTPNPELARRTVDIFELFGGELTLGPVRMGVLGS